MSNSNLLLASGRLRLFQAVLLLVIAASGLSSGRADEAGDIASAKSISRAIRAVSKRIIPSVVKIKTTIHPADPAPQRAGRRRPATRKRVPGVPRSLVPPCGLFVLFVVS